MGVAEALHALAHGQQDQFMEWVEALAGQQQVPGWDATVSRELVSYLASRWPAPGGTAGSPLSWCAMRAGRRVTRMPGWPPT